MGFHPLTWEEQMGISDYDKAILEEVRAIRSNLARIADSLEQILLNEQHKEGL